MAIKSILFVLFFVISASLLTAQTKKDIYAGFQFRPIFPNDFLNTGAASVSDSTTVFDIIPKTGFNFGFIIRKNISKTWSFETGISTVKRTYNLRISSPDTFTNNRIILNYYELPLNWVVNIPVSEKIYISSSLGLPINLVTRNYFYNGPHFKDDIIRYRMFKIGISGNLGIEYRSEKNGIFYIGTTIQRPFGPIYGSRMKHTETRPPFSVKGEKEFDYSGSYFTLDFRYFLPRSK